jgi:O-antigen/teichoic acid export membrane protein
MRLNSIQMTTSTRILASRYIARLIAHVRTPLYRNGYALVFSSATTSALGVLYWALAARKYTTDAVGLNSAVMSAMMFLANVSQLNMVNALNRFVPSAGRATRRLVVYAYLISLLMALAVSLIFILGVNAWAPALSFLRSSPLFILWFTLATMAWCIFVLQDSVLTGLRQATWVPIENVFFALAKIALLIGLAKALPQYGVFASWTMPLVAILLLVNLLIFLRLIPQHVRATENQAVPIVPAQIVKYVAGDYLGSLVWMASTSLLPILVLERVGATANAYFYLSWTIAYSLYLVSRNMGMSLIAEAATDPEKLDSYSYRVFIQTSRLLVPVIAIVVLGAPHILRIFGHDYATEGTALLRLLCLSALPNIVTSLYVDVARVQRRMTAIVLVFTSLCILVLTLSYFLLEVYGITGVGIAWLLGQTIIAGGLVLTQLRTAWSSHLDVRILLRVPAVPRRLWRNWQRRRFIASARSLVPDILPTISPPTDAPPPITWSVQRSVRTINEVAMVTLGPTGQPPAAMLKLPQADYAVASLRRERKVLTDLHADPRLEEWHALVPKLLAEGEIAGHPYVVEQMLPGIKGHAVLSSPAARARMQVAAAAAIGELHRRTATSIVADAKMLRRWIDEPLLLIRQVNATRPRAASNEKAMNRLATQLHSTLAGRTFSVSWVHGDFSPGNILVTPDGAMLTGIVDWELAVPDELPQLDLLQLLLSTRTLVQRRELGDTVRELLNGGNWTPHEQVLLDAAQSVLPGDEVGEVGMRAMVLLCWLRHIAGNLTKSTHYARHKLWIAKNVESVLQCL